MRNRALTSETIISIMEVQWWKKILYLITGNMPNWKNLSRNWMNAVSDIKEREINKVKEIIHDGYQNDRINILPDIFNIVCEYC
jgi:hypothetical protein